MAWTRDDGWVWVFACVDHFTAEAWAHVAKIGDRHAVLQPVYDAVIDRWGRLDADIACGVAVRHDWGSQYRSVHFQESLRWLGITDDPAYVGEPETNGCAEYAAPSSGWPIHNIRSYLPAGSTQLLTPRQALGVLPRPVSS